MTMIDALEPCPDCGSHHHKSCRTIHARQKAEHKLNLELQKLLLRKKAMPSMNKPNAPGEGSELTNGYCMHQLWASECDICKRCPGEVRARGEGSELPALEPYYVEVEDDGCEKCNHGKLWNVVYRTDDIRTATSYGNQEEAEEIVDLMNSAFAKGKAALSSPQQEWISCPDSQGWWWHSYGQDSHPHPYGILVSNTGPQVRYFINYPDSRWCDEVGGFWLKQPFPAPPVTAEGKDTK